MRLDASPIPKCKQTANSDRSFLSPDTTVSIARHISSSRVADLPIGNQGWNELGNMGSFRYTSTLTLGNSLLPFNNLTLPSECVSLNRLVLGMIPWS